MLPFQPETMVQLRARYSDAIRNVFNVPEDLTTSITPGFKCAVHYWDMILSQTFFYHALHGESNFSGIGAYEHNDLKAKIEISCLAEEIKSLLTKNKMLA